MLDQPNPSPPQPTIPKVDRAEIPDFNDLPGQVWPRNAQRQEDGVVTIAGVPLPEIAEEYGTPVFVVDEDDFRSRCRDMAQAFGGGEHVHYASKAFLTTTIARWVDEEGLCLDVASEGELRVALAAGFPAERVTAHGNNKSTSFLKLCVDAGVGHVVLDAPGELDTLNAVAAEAGRVQEVMVRVKPGVEAHTHEFIATSHEDQKFGFSLAAGSAHRAAQAVMRAENLSLVGLHCHVGSQVFDAEGFSLAAERVLGLWSQLAKEGAELEILDLGGGYGIAYTADEQPLDVKAIAADLLARIDAHAAARGIEAPKIMVEPGRAIAGPSTVTVYDTGVIKDVHVDDTTLHVYPTASANKRSVNMPDYVGSKFGKHDFEVSDLRADSGATVAYVRLNEGSTMASYFVDLDGLTLYVASDLDRAENLVWAFDDLLIVVSSEGILAFTPSSSGA